MAITDRQRTELHKAAEEKMGPGPADTLMACLPPVGWADVATKRDLGELEARIDLRFEVSEHKLMAAFEKGLKDLSVKFFLGMTAQTVALVGLVFAAAHLMG